MRHGERRRIAMCKGGLAYPPVLMGNEGGGVGLPQIVAAAAAEQDSLACATHRSQKNRHIPRETALCLRAKALQ
jgi:hypothetical protein